MTTPPDVAPIGDEALDMIETFFASITDDDGRVVGIETDDVLALMARLRAAEAERDELHAMFSKSDAWRLVPVDPTPGQLEAAAFNLSDEFGPDFVLAQRAFAMAVYSEMLNAAPKPPTPEPRQQWRPISDAPRDGTNIDVWVGGEFPRRIADVSWREPTDSEWWVHGGDTIDVPDATWFDGFGPLGRDQPPTHWMPLPPPPEGAA